MTAHVDPNAAHAVFAPSGAPTASLNNPFKHGCDPAIKSCADCDVNLADPPSKLCPGCQAYREHTS
jgi:hypothetical protein